MGCSCKDNEQAIKDGRKLLEEFRELFIKRMTVDSETHDARRKDFNQAIFNYYDDEDIRIFNETCEKFGLPKKHQGQTYPVWNIISMDMVLRCFDDAVKDWRKTFCDVPDCRRKIK